MSGRLIRLWSISVIFFFLLLLQSVCSAEQWRYLGTYNVAGYSSTKAYIDLDSIAYGKISYEMYNGYSRPGVIVHSGGALLRIVYSFRGIVQSEIWNIIIRLGTELVAKSMILIKRSYMIHMM